MLPFSLSFRRLVRKNIPQLKVSDLERHESLIALRQQVAQEIKILPGEQDIAVYPESYDYGSVTKGSSKSHIFEIKNEGTADLEVEEVSLQGPQAAYFKIKIEEKQKTKVKLVKKVESFKLQPGENRKIEVIFTVTSTGKKNAFLLIKSNDPDESSLQVQLSGFGVAEQVPDIAVKPAALDFGDVGVKSSSVLAFEVLNEGTAELALDPQKPMEIIGPDADQFTVEIAGLLFKIAPNESQCVNVGFQPTSLGDKNATLRIVSNDPDENPLHIPLTGYGVENVPMMTVSGVRRSTQLNGQLGYREDLVDRASKKANAILAGYKKQYEAVLRLWIARRQFAIQQGNYLQIPSSWESVKNYSKAFGNYVKVRIQTFFILVPNRIRYFFENLSIGQGVAVVIGALLIFRGCLALTPVESEKVIKESQPFTTATISVPTAVISNQPFTIFSIKISADTTFPKYDSTYVIAVPFDTTNKQPNATFTVKISSQPDSIKYTGQIK